MLSQEKTLASKRNDGSIDLNASVRGMSGKRRICHISGQRLYAELINRHLNDNAWSKVALTIAAVRLFSVGLSQQSRNAAKAPGHAPSL